jgi:hypothetical protein
MLFSVKTAFREKHPLGRVTGDSEAFTRCLIGFHVGFAYQHGPHVKFSQMITHGFLGDF